MQEGTLLYSSWLTGTFPTDQISGKEVNPLPPAAAAAGQEQTQQQCGGGLPQLQKGIGMVKHA